jgi:hypothetical protein
VGSGVDGSGVDGSDVPQLESSQVKWAACGRGATIVDNGTGVVYAGSRCGCIGSFGFKEGEHVFEVSE